MSKRANGDGTRITRHASGKLWTRVTLSDGTRKPFYGDTHREVREKRDEYLADYRAGRISTDAAQLVSKYLRDWLNSCNRIKPRTREDYERQIGLSEPYIGKVRLDQLKPSHVQALYDELEGRGLSATSVEKVHRVLRIAFRRAVKLGYILRSPTEIATPPRPEYIERETLTADQVRAFLQHTRDDRLRALWIVFLLQGLRLGEALGLRWSDIDFESERLSVRQTVQRVYGTGLAIGTPKTTRSRRTLDLVPMTVAALKTRRTAQIAEHLATTEWEGVGEWEGLIFTTPAGGPIDPGTVSKMLHRRLAAAGLPELRVHDLRHTYATLLNEEGCDLLHVQHALGHSSYHLTANTYTHPRRDQRSPVLAHMERLFSLGEDAG